PAILERAFSVTAPYMPKAAGAHLPDNSRISTQWTRRMNSLKLWLTLRVHGRKGYEDLIGRQLELAKSFASWVEGSNDFELTVPQTLPIVAFRLRQAALSLEQLATAHGNIVDEVTHDGRRWISETSVKGQSTLRMMVISYLTEQRHLEGLQSALTKAVNKLILRAPTKA
ncbi:MAG TPA: pyridoxal-dependent decarboxylase, partial [Terriglobales bacterium]|nr:pyridoxal-dependent decarboxylase [Terriglobales bacterium]